jgi:hypothetical protein
MFTRANVVVRCIFLTMLLVGCYNSEQLSREDLLRGTNYDICEVVTRDGEHIMLKQVAGSNSMINDSTLVLLREDGKVLKLPVSQVESVKVTYVDTLRTVFLILGITAGVIGAVMALAGGPLGGA